MAIKKRKNLQKRLPKTRAKDSARAPKLKKKPAKTDDNGPFETRELRNGLKVFLDQKIKVRGNPKSRRLGSFKYGVYVFHDYDGEPIYVGQTRENLSARIRRHLTNQRTDAVAMNVLDPFEVYAITVWPIPKFERRGRQKTPLKNIEAGLNALEATVFRQVLKESKFRAVLNEKIPVSRRTAALPRSYYGVIVSDQVKDLRGDMDTRIARRAATIAKLAQVISERQVKAGLRRTLVTQAKRLQSLAQKRFKKFEGTAAREDRQKGAADHDED